MHPYRSKHNATALLLISLLLAGNSNLPARAEADNPTLPAGVTTTQVVAPVTEAGTTPTPKAPAEVKPAVIDETPLTLQGSLNKTDPLPIDLPAVIRLVEEKNLFIQSRKALAQIEKSRYRQRQAALLPNILGDYNQNRFQGGVQIFGGQTLTIFRTTVQPQLTANWTLYPGGRNIYEMLAAKRRTVAANWGVSETYQQQLTQAIQEYYSLLEAQLERDNALQSIRELQNQVRINEAKWKAGTGTKLDWMRSQTQQAQQERVLVNAENRVAQVEQALLNRLDLDVNVSLEAKLPNTPLADLRHVLVPESSEIASLVRVAITNHPSLKRFNEEIRALGIDYKAIRSDFLPSVTLTTFMNGTGPRFADLALSRFGGLAINVNLLENLGLRIPFRLQEKRAEIAQRILDQKTQLRAVEASVVQAFLNIRAFDKNIQVSAQEEALAQEAYRLALGRYQAGVGINIDVIDSQTDLANARNNLARAVLNYNRAQVQLLEALGLVSPDHLIHGVTANDLTP